MFARKNKYVYTCPDVVNYRKNQIRLAVWSNVLAVATQVLLFGGLALAVKKTNPTPIETDITEIPNP